MNYEIQRASVSKRISAFLFDSILTGIAIVAVAWLLALILGYDKQKRRDVPPFLFFDDYLIYILIRLPA